MIRSVILTVALVLTASQARPQLPQDSQDASAYPFSMTIDEIFTPRDTPLETSVYHKGYLRCAALLQLLGEQAAYDQRPVDKKLLYENVFLFSYMAWIYGGAEPDESMSDEETHAIVMKYFGQEGQYLYYTYGDWINAADIRNEVLEDAEHPLSRDYHFCEKMATILQEKSS